METSDLTPSIWRTCRVLANAKRLQLLTAIARQGPLVVSQAACVAGVSEVVATTGLRALQARGLLTSTRDSRWVRYAALPDPLVSHAEALLSITTNAIAQDETPARLIQAFTAFTHPRRIRLVQVLATAPLSIDQLTTRCEISSPALRRHLAKLARRGVVVVDSKHRWQLTVPATPLLRDLVLIILGARRTAAHTLQGVSRGSSLQPGREK